MTIERSFRPSPKHLITQYCEKCGTEIPDDEFRCELCKLGYVSDEPIETENERAIRIALITAIPIKRKG